MALRVRSTANAGAEASHLEWLGVEYARRHRALVVYAARLLRGDAERAAECVNEACLALIETNGIPSPKAGEHLRKKLFLVIRRKALNMRRRERRTELGRLFDEAADAHTSPDRVFERRNLRRAQSKAIAALSARQQQAFVLCDVEELSHREAAERMGIAISTVRNHLDAARKGLREALDQYRGWTD